MTTAPLPSQRSIGGSRVVLPGGTGPAVVHIEGNHRPSVASQSEPPRVDERTDGHLLVPALAYPHVHVSEQGRTEWDGHCTATSAAAIGGVTTLSEMQRRRAPVPNTPAALAQKSSAMASQLHTDSGLWGGVVPENTCEVRPMGHRGIRGFKCFLCPSGIGAFPHVGLRTGAGVDSIACEPDASLVEDDQQLVRRRPSAPDQGQTLNGRMHDTGMRGQRIVHDGPLVSKCQGRSLLTEP